MPGGAQGLLGVGLVLERKGRQLGDDSPWQARRADLVDDAGERVRVRQARENVRRLGGDVRGAGLDGDAGRRGFLAAPIVDVVTDDLPSGRRETASVGSSAAI